jgi:hypothetical protein
VSWEFYERFYRQFILIYEEKHRSKKEMHKHKSHPEWHPITRVHKQDVDESNMEIKSNEHKLTPKEKAKEKAKFNSEYKEWLKSIDAEGQIKAAIEEEKTKYMSFENVQVICARCHYAGHKGKDLCPVCKKKYKLIKYETCFDCIPEDRKKKIEEKQREEEDFIREMDELDDKEYEEEEVE